jgi:hypothetical protein
MIFNNISWSSHEAVDSKKLSRMAQNDNLNYTLASKAPAGLLAVHNLSPSTATGYKFIEDDNYRLIKQLNIYNKNYIALDAARYFRINISDFLIQDTATTGTLTDIRQGIILRFALDTLTGEDPTDFGVGVELFEYISMLKPHRLQSSPTYASRQYFKYQGGEIIFPCYKSNFVLNMYVKTRRSRYSDGILKSPVKCASTANITLSGTRTVDGVTASPGDRVLVKNQASSAQNGVYTVQSGAWTKISADSGLNSQVDVRLGTVNGGRSFYMSSVITNSWVSIGYFIAHSDSIISIEDIGEAPSPTVSLA